MSNALKRKLQQAEQRLHAGDAPGAQSLCEQVLRQAPRNPDALCLLGVAHLSLGRAGDAVPALARALAADPRNGAALEYLGLAHLMLGQFAEAQDVLQRAAGLDGAPASVFMRLGIAILEQGRPGEALPSLRRALDRAPDDPDCHLNLGRARADMGDAAAAAEHFQSALRLAPQHVDAAFNLGVIELQRNDWVRARQWFERALAQAPGHVDARVNLGIVCQRQGSLDEAEECLRPALRLAPGNAHALHAMGQTLALQHRLHEARDHYLAALRAAPDMTAVHEDLAAVSSLLGRTGEALHHLEIAVHAEPRNSEALATLAGALFEAGRLDEAQAAAQRVIELDPANASAYATHANVSLVRNDLEQATATLESGYARTQASALLGMLAYQLRQACDWPRWRQAWNEMAPLIETEAALGSPFWLLCEPTTPQQQLAYTRRWAAARFGQLTRAAAPTARAARPPGRLRIGYLSSDLHDHATAYLMAEVFERHDRDRFEVFAYSYGPEDGSAMRERLRRAFEHFVDVARMPDDLVVERMRNDALDVLVDLKGYTLGDRLTILAHRPCAIQMTWLGYPGTTAAEFIDYAIADPFVVAPAAESNYSERMIRLPHCYQPNDRKRAVAEPRGRTDYGLPADALVFCCFNQTYKITPEVFAVWMRLLRDVPHSVLWLLEGNALATRNLLAAARQQGVDPGRLMVAPRLPNDQHLARYQVADLALDTFPYTSHTTLSDALWCGCPAVALCGETFASRVSGSIMTAAGLPELVTYSLEHYEQLAVRIASDPQRLNELRARTRQARDESPLFDSERFTRDLENEYSRLLRGQQ